VNENILIVPRHKVFLRFLNIPSTDDPEIKNMAAIQAIKEVPLPKEEIVADCRNIGLAGDSVSLVMLAIAKKKTILEILKGHKAIRLETELLYLFLFEKGMLDKNGVDCVIKAGREYSELMITDKANPVFSRSFRSNRNLADEIKLSLSNYRKDGASSGPDNLKIIYEQGIDVKDINPLILNNFVIPVSFYELKEDLGRYSLSAQIDLTPPELSEKNIKARRKKELTITCALAAAAFLLSAVFMNFKSREGKEILGMISSKIEALRPDMDRIENRIELIHSIEAGNKRAKALSDIIEYSYKYTPRHVRISGLSYDGERNFYLSGTAGDMSDIVTFTKELETAGYFSAVEIKRAAKSAMKEQERTDFNIQCVVAI
jgi:hypothetical protein